MQIDNSNISKIIRRLELIKNLILLEDESDIVLQTLKLEVLATTDEINEIVSLLKEKAYTKAITLIEDFINRYKQLTVYMDPEIEALKLEIKVLEAELNTISDEKAEAEKLIYEFSVRHNHELGELLIKILKLRKEKAKDTPEETEAEDDYNNYYKEYNETRNEVIAELTADDQKELKDKYRKASKLCHPDIVSDEYKAAANELFVELNAAYGRNDLQRVKEILSNLEKGNFFINKSDAINEKKLLQTAMEKLRNSIAELKRQLQAIKQSDAYVTITGIDDWDTYFADAKEKLTAHLNGLTNEQ